MSKPYECTTHVNEQKYMNEQKMNEYKMMNEQKKK